MAGCFYILAIVNNTTMNIEVHLSFWISILVVLDKHPEVEILKNNIEINYVKLFKIDKETWLSNWTELICTSYRNDAKAETPVLWPHHAKSGLIGKDSDAGRDWGQEEKGTTDDETAGWHHWLDRCESEWTLGVGDGQGGLACCDSWGRKESDTTERLNWTELNDISALS